LETQRLITAILRKKNFFRKDATKQAYDEKQQPLQKTAKE
jgi:hypothetical protein